jgi:streptomycin 6-kinase
MVSGTPGQLLASGRDADVYEIDGGRVLRRYRHGGDVTEEVAVMAYVEWHGFPVPRVYEADGADLVMERVDGPTMLRSLLDGDTDPVAGGELLADLHTRLHALPPRRSGGPGARVLHLDIHPDNVILGARGPVLIDWRNTEEGPPDFDLALSALIMAEVVVGSHLPAEFVPTARALLAAFLDRAGGDPGSQLDRALAYRTANPTLTPAEKSRLPAAAALVAAGSSDLVG